MCENLDTAPRLAGDEYFIRCVVGPSSRDNADLMPAFGQRRRQFRQMLRRGDNVWIKRLVQKEYFHLRPNARRQISKHWDGGWQAGWPREPAVRLRAQD